MIDTTGIDNLGNRYIIHPDSKKVILGFEIPHFEEMKSFVIELSKIVPEQKYVGWDIVLTENGWVMMEGNCGGQLISFQMTRRKGNRPIIEKVFLNNSIEETEKRIVTKK